MKNKRFFFALISLTTAALSAGIILKKHQKRYSGEERIQQAEKYKKAVNDILNEECLRDFGDFTSALDEYYGITAKCYDGETIEYSSDNCPNIITSKEVICKSENAEIRLPCMSDLNDYFFYNKTDSADKPQEHYSPFYYGKHWHNAEPILLNRRNLSISANHLLCGLAGTGKTSLMEHEIKSVLHHTNDRVFVITAANEYNGIADGYNAPEMIDDRKSNPIHIPDDKRFVVYSLEKIRYENQSALPEYYLKCLETVWEYVSNNVNPDRISWIFIDDIQDIICDERCMSLLTDIIKKARTHGCTVTLSIQSLNNPAENDTVKSLLANANFLTLFTLRTADKDFILNYFKDILSEADILFLEQLCYKRQCGTGLHIVNDRLINDKNSGNLTAIPFEIKL